MIVLAAEVTERRVDESRVESTFTTKTAERGVTDYLFFGSPDEATGAVAKAQQSFAQGHHINFIDLRLWMHNVLATIGSEGRAAFADELLAVLNEADLPATLKVTWNDIATAVASGR